ncbi:MAG: hypothetical protein DMF89_12135 [Acidobacteria bacterium]|nr:MAG: hypothetical protein DMF89_12135 [Acidobacteriota bacterium]
MPQTLDARRASNVNSLQLSAFSSQLSAFSFQLSALSLQISAFSFQPSRRPLGIYAAARDLRSLPNLEGHTPKAADSC